jgi:alanine racemase
MGIVPIGYADIPFVNSKKLCVYVNGTKRNVLALSMDQIVIESTTKDKLGDIVELFGKHQSIYDFIQHDIPSIITHLCNRINKQYINGI